jgi:hypothetical protein
MRKLVAIMTSLMLASCASDFEYDYQKQLSLAKSEEEALSLIRDVTNTNPDEYRRRLAWLWDKSTTELPNSDIYESNCVRLRIVKIAIEKDVEYLDQIRYVKSISNDDLSDTSILCLMEVMSRLADDESIIYLAEKTKSTDEGISNRAKELLKTIQTNGDDKTKLQLNYIMNRYKIEL